MGVSLHLGDCLEILPALDAASVDSIICDPPYSLNFMGKDWDKAIPGVPFWAACLRVAKPGAMLLAFGGTRTHHRLMCAIEDAGWEIRDCLMWLYGSGFPKSHDISKAIDREAGAEREVVGTKVGLPGYRNGDAAPHTIYGDGLTNGTLASAITAPATDAAKAWAGYGTALKPAWEPIILAMKPLDGTYSHNAITHGVAGLNVDGCRIGSEPAFIDRPGRKSVGGIMNVTSEQRVGHGGNGRWPANLILDEESAALLDEASGESGSNWRQRKAIGGNAKFDGKYANGERYDAKYDSLDGGYADTGGASRFFWVAKAARAERNQGLAGMEERPAGVHDDDSYVWPLNGDGSPRGKKVLPRANHHPTVKPLSLMRYLCRLTKTPWGGTVLDPFMGSGTTGAAAVMEGRSFVGIEIDAEYFALAEKRIDRATWQPMLLEVE